MACIPAIHRRPQLGAAAAIAAAVGPLLGGFVTTYLSWRVGFLLEVVSASLLGLFNSFRMLRLPDVPASASAEASLLG